MKTSERSELSNLIYLKGQAMERNGLPMDQNLLCQDEAIEMEELNARETGKPKSDLLARLYRVKGQMLEYLDKKDEAVIESEKALEAYKALPGDNQDVIQRLEGYIK